MKSTDEWVVLENNDEQEIPHRVDEFDDDEQLDSDEIHWMLHDGVTHETDEYDAHWIYHENCVDTVDDDEVDNEQIV